MIFSIFLRHLTKKEIEMAIELSHFLLLIFKSLLY